MIAKLQTSRGFVSSSNLRIDEMIETIAPPVFLIGLWCQSVVKWGGGGGGINIYSGQPSSQFWYLRHTSYLIQHYTLYLHMVTFKSGSREKPLTFVRILGIRREDLIMTVFKNLM